jgi:hypothetical protein
MMFPYADYKRRRVAEYCQTAADAGYLVEVLPPEEEERRRRLHKETGIHVPLGWWVLTWEEGQPRPDPCKCSSAPGGGCAATKL